MKHFFTCIFLLSTFYIIGQEDLKIMNDSERIALTTIISDQTIRLTPSAETILQDKLNQIVSNNGMVGNPRDGRFLMVANVMILSKDITPTAPPMHAYTLSVSFYIGDGIEGKLFSSISKNITGVGKSETAAFLNALKKLNINDPGFEQLISEGKESIIEYYNTKCDFILKEADMLASRDEFKAAIATLSNVPLVCKQCYDKAIGAIGPVYQQYINSSCEKALSKARNIWFSNQNYSGAEQAANLISEINPEAECHGDAIKFMNEIGARVKQLDDREWDFKIKRHEDKITAAREIAVAYWSNQPKNVTYNYRGWW